MADPKILMIVDDDVDDRFFFCSAVKDIDPLWECRQADNGMEALEQLRSAERLPDFIFLDVNMYLMDGRTCLVELKKDRRLRHIPVIMYSTSSSQSDIDMNTGLGACYYLLKTSDISDLSEEITKAMLYSVENINT